MNEKTLFRWGALFAIVGAFLGGAVNALHPRFLGADDPTVLVLNEIAVNTDMWSWIHLGIIIAVLMVTAGFVAIGRSIGGNSGSSIARFGIGAALIGAAVGAASLSFDGFALAEMSGIYEGATGSQQAAALMSFRALTAASSGLFVMFTLTFFGIAPSLFGFAIMSGEGYPKLMGAIAALAGFAGIGIAIAGTYTGVNDTFQIVFAASSGLLTLWVLIMGFLLWRKGSAAA